MKKWLHRIKKSILLATMLALLIAVPVLAYTYSASITVTESDSVGYEMLPIIVTVNNTYLRDHGYISTNGTDTRVLEASNVLHHMMADNKTLFCANISAGSQVNFDYTLGNSPLSSFPVIVGYGGYVTASDDSSIELGDNFSFEVNGWIDTDNGTNKNLIYKQNAFRLYVSENVSGNITAEIDFLLTTTENITSLITPAMLSHNGLADWHAANLTDSDVTNFGFHTDTAGVGSWMLIDFGNGNRQSLTGWRYYVRTNNVNALWDIQYSTDNSSWTTTYTGLDVFGTAGWHSATWSSTGSYRYWRSYKTDVAAIGDYHTELDVESGGKKIWLSTANMNSKRYKVKVSDNGTHVKLLVDSSEKDSAILSGSVNNSANNWVFLQNNVMPYADNITISVNGTQQLYFAPQAMILGTNLPDRAGSNNGVITWGSNPAGIAVSIGGLESTGITAPVSVEEPASPDYVSETPTVDLFTETTGEDIPMFYPFFKMASDVTGWPIQVFWITGAILMSMVAGTITLMYMHSMLIVGVVTGCIVAAFCSMDIIPWWTLYVWGFMAVCFIVYQRVVSV